jgi:hypothetical protein
MKRNIIYGVILPVLTLLLFGCGSNSKVDADVGVQNSASLSIVYESTSYDPTKGIIARYHVHAVDENANPIVGLNVQLSLINGVKEIRGTKLQYGTGNILSSTPITFGDNFVNFAKSDVSINDTLIILPTSSKRDNSYIGGWLISGIDSMLTLSGRSLHLESTTDLNYIIGNDERFLGRQLAVAHVEKPGEDTTGVVTDVTDSKGYAYFDVVFDPILAGHTVTLAAQTDGNRMAVASVEALRWNTYVGETITVPNSGGRELTSMGLSILIEGTTENLIDLDIVPSSFIIEPSANCSLNAGASNLHTNAYGNVLLAINTDGNVTATENCTVSWEGQASSMYYEY